MMHNVDIGLLIIPNIDIVYKLFFILFKLFKYCQTLLDAFKHNLKLTNSSIISLSPCQKVKKQNINKSKLFHF